MSKRLEVFGRDSSSNVQMVMWTIAELGLDCVRHDVGGAFGGNDDDAFRAMSPMGLVPAFKDGDLTVFESGAIVRYLGARYGNDAFWPKDPARRADLDQWAEWSKTALYTVLIKSIFWHLIRTPEAEKNHSKFEEDVAQLAELMTMAEARLGNAEFFGGKSLSFVDIAIGHLLYRYFTLEIDRIQTPRLAAYYERLKARPTYAEHVMVDYNFMKVT